MEAVLDMDIYSHTHHRLTGLLYSIPTATKTLSRSPTLYSTACVATPCWRLAHSAFRFFIVESSQGPIDAYGSGFELDLSWCTSDTDGVASPLVHHDNPNSNTGHRLNHQSPNTQNPDYSNQLTPIDSPYGQFPADPASALDNTQEDVRVTDDTIDYTARDSAWRHQKPDITEPITAIYYPFDPTQLIDGGLLWPILDTSNNTPLPGDTNLLKGPSPTMPPNNGTPDYDLSTIFNWPFEADDSIFMSPNTSESCTTDWTFESTSLGEQPPPFSPSDSTSSLYNSDPPDFPSPPRLATFPLPPPLPPPPPLLPPPPQSSPGVILTKSESDARVASLKSQRRHRGVGRSLVELKCPFCGKIHRRPHALQEHIDSVHHKLSLYKCPRLGCCADFGTKSNRTRHLKKCRFPER